MLTDSVYDDRGVSNMLDLLVSGQYIVTVAVYMLHVISKVAPHRHFVNRILVPLQSSGKSCLHTFHRGCIVSTKH